LQAFFRLQPASSLILWGNMHTPQRTSATFTQVKPALQNTSTAGFHSADTWQTYTTYSV